MPANVFRILEAFPGATAFPSVVSLTLWKSSVFALCVKNFSLCLIRNLSSKRFLTQLPTTGLRHNSSCRILALNFSAICRVFLQTKFACPPLYRSESDAKPLHQNGIARRCVAIAELLSYCSAKRIIFLQATHLFTCFRIPISCSILIVQMFLQLVKPDKER